MSPTDDRGPTRARGLLALGGFLAPCLAVWALNGAVTATSVDGWYRTLSKPAFNPPDWVFAPVWSALYVMMALAAWLVWRRVGLAGGRIALSLWGVQLALNLAWSILFFGLNRIGLALVDIVLLLLAIATTTVAFWRIDARAGLLFLPYLLWVGYATVLNGALWALN